jgi:hypothetical protein
VDPSASLINQLFSGAGTSNVDVSMFDDNNTVNGLGLSNIFLKFTFANVSYDYSYFQEATINHPIQPCTNNIRTGNTWCGIIPSIDNPDLYDSDGWRMIPESGGGYRIKTPGYYTLRFGVTVDEEQTPVYKLLVDWGGPSDSLVTRSDVDASQNFAFVKYINPSDTTNGTLYYIGIKVQDNWGFYMCDGLPTSTACSSFCIDNFGDDYKTLCR